MSIVKFNDRLLSPFLPRVANDFWSDFFPMSTQENLRSLPATNIKENEKEYLLDIAIPGMKKEDINVEIEDGRLCISAESEKSVEENEEEYTRKEFSYSSFKRAFSLPENAVDKVTAKYQDGVLHISLPKRKMETSKPKRIKVA